jgi:type I restriction enzyme, S subunit
MTASDWPRVRLEELGKWFGGGTPSKSNLGFWTDGTIPWLSPKDMGPEVLAGTQDHITQDAVENSSVKRVPAGSVALVVRSGILERTLPVAVVPFDTTLNQDMKAVVARPDITARWIAWGLRASEQELLRTCRKAGTTVASMEMPRLYEHTIPVPPLDVQRRIVDILEDHLSRLDAATGLLESAGRRASAWSRSLIDATLWGNRTPHICVSDLLAEPMRNGHSARAVRDSAGGIRTLTLTAVTRNEFSDRFTKLTSADPDRVSSLWLRDGDVLVQRSNTPELVGTTARYEGPDHWAIFPDLLIRLRANEQLVLSTYLCLALRSERAHRQMRSQAKGLAGSMPKIDQTTIGATLVPIPDLETQRSHIQRIDEVELIKARTIRAEATGRSRGLLLRQALLAAAFSGRLTGHSSDVEIVEEMAGV